jgi:class 3 adenylate cyclase
MRNQLPSDVTTTELGTHRLRGLPEPETLYQLGAPDLPQRFPPLAVS